MNYNHTEYLGNTTASASRAGLRPPAGTVGSSGQSARPASGPRGAEGRQSTADQGSQPTAPQRCVRRRVNGAQPGGTQGATALQLPCNSGSPQPNPEPTGSEPQQGGSQPARHSSQDRNNIPRNRRIPRTRKVTRGTTTIATLNIRGASGANTAAKWIRINDTLKTDRIGVIALQETHLLSDSKIQEINDKPGFRLHLLHSGDPNAPQARGVGFALNKSLTRWQEATVKTIIPGRALLLKLPWHNDATLQILNVYAPNAETENRDFWRILKTKWTTSNLPKPDILLGDFNITEEPIDKEPAKPSNAEAVTALRNFRTHLQLVDAWRNDNPYEEKFTWQQLPDRTTSSRLDRIYLTEHLQKHSCDWKMEWSVVRTDHKMVSTKIYDPGMPYIGRGRWTVPLHLLHDKEVKAYINKSGNDLATALEKWKNDADAPPTQPQTLYAEWKQKAIEEIRQMARTKIPKMDARLTALRTDLTRTQLNPHLSPAEKIAQKAVLEQSILELTEARHTKQRDNMMINGWMNRETLRKPWINENKERKARDTLNMIKLPSSNPPEYTRKTDEMLDIARTHHDGLQDDDLPPDRETHERWTEEVTGTPESVLDNGARASLEEEFTDEEIRQAITSLPNGKSPGLDGLPHEFWKILMDRADTYSKQQATRRALAQQRGQMILEEQEDEEKKEPVDIVAILLTITRNIAQHGLAPGTRFAEGWMCPIYKKKDRTEIANYRPITVLNADYKLITRVLAMRLAKVAPGIINSAQAGFMTGRHISDHTDLTQYMLSRCELEEENGAVIFLDQEKAYDKVLHPYLWEVMKSMNFPDSFINTVKTLYSDAYTTIIINGVLGKPFKIRRGVRQGDPMSCLLFNIAIEPLSRMLRQSDLKGFEIKNHPERLITTLFADDTTVYMSKDDDFNKLQSILQKWCKASGGKFNVSKTEILPLGTADYRKSLIDNRSLNPDQDAIPQHIRIVNDGDHTRTLGAFVGNNINEISVWSPVLDGVERALARWARGKPTQEGLRLTANMEIGGRTQYLTRAQGMPKEVLLHLEKRIGKFMWAGKQAMIKKSFLQTPRPMGGRRLLDIDARNEAITLRRLQAWCRTGTDRPIWAWVADEILGQNINAYTTVIPSHVTHLGLQDLSPKAGSRTVKLPNMLKSLLEAREQYNVIFNPPALAREAKRSLPIWHHISDLKLTSNMLNGGAAPDDEGPRRKNNWSNLKDLTCIGEKHNVRRVGEVQDLAGGLTTANHMNRKNCKCDECTKIRADTHCDNPHRCMTLAKVVLQAIPPKYHPGPADHEVANEQPEGQGIEPGGSATLFDKSVAITHLGDGFRVLGRTKEPNPNPIVITPPQINDDTPTITVYTDGSCEHNGEQNAIAGAGYWFGPEHPDNGAVKLPDHMEQSNNSAELTAILKVVQTVDPSATLIIKTDSQYAINGLTKQRRSNEDKGWIETANKDIFRAIIGHMRKREGATYLEKVKGHAGIQGNEEADRLANQGAKKDLPDEIDLTVPDGYEIEGARLNTLTQAMIYKGICENRRKDMAPRTATFIMLEMTRLAVEERCGILPTDKAIWQSISNPDIDRKARAFLYRALHQSHRIGSYWDKITNFEQRAYCRVCDTVESMEHVLTECQMTGQNKIWLLTEQLLENRGMKIGPRTIGGILGCAIPTHKLPNGRPDKPKNRFFTVVMTESLYLIWLLRCEWRIDKEEDILRRHTPTEIEARWRARLNMRIRLDQAMGTKLQHRWRKVSKKLALKTWQGSLANEDRLPEDWLRERGVLVSTERRPRGRNR